MFLELGYAETTIAAVAAEAGVSVETIYKTFRSKAGLLKGVIDVAIVGDEEPVPMLQRNLVQQIEDEPDPRQKFELYGEHLRTSAPRRVPLELLTRDAAAADQAAATLRKELSAERLTGMGHFAKHLERANLLRSGLGWHEARDVLWLFNSAEVFELLVIDRKWSPRKYARWVANALAATLLWTNTDSQSTRRAAGRGGLR
jgi:AcrR family transcriptional regulator